MCGIAAIIGTRPDALDPSIARMVDRLAHRGPDDSGVQRHDGALLGHRRLSIIDLAGGAQPMPDANGRFCIVFNGEIYNFRELRGDLEGRGCRFQTHSDTEVLLQAYRTFGQRTPSLLNGQFAFAIWDRDERVLFAARDRLGEKPLYWAAADDGNLLIASEIKSILASGLLRPRLDPLAVDAYLALMYVPPDRTIYENVHTLRPAHAMEWKDGQLRQWCYWEPRFSENQTLSFADAASQARSLIEQAVRRQMVADVPVGAFLSGGLDSTTIVALMSGLSEQPVKTFSVGFGDLIDELPYAREVASAYGTEHHEIQMNITVGELLEKMVDVYDEPFADSSNIPTYLVAQFARRHVKVCLSGDGGDEVFGGYSWYTPLLVDSTYKTAVAALGLQYLRLKILALLTRLGLPLRGRRDAAGEAWAGARLRRQHPDLWRRHLAHVCESASLREGLWGRQNPVSAEESLSRLYLRAAATAPLDQVVDFDLLCYLPGDILVKVDRAAMANSLETRAPFLDVDLVEFVLSLPPNLRFWQNGLKNLMREACQDLWPEVVRNRTKQGFGAPIANWVRRPDVRPLLARVTRKDSALCALLPGAARAATSAPPQTVWSLLCLGLWLEKHSECLSHS
jgi:asparagine synthase (glutamine-hydrolysing)